MAVRPDMNQIQARFLLSSALLLLNTNAACQATILPSSELSFLHSTSHMPRAICSSTCHKSQEISPNSSS